MHLINRTLTTIVELRKKKLENSPKMIRQTMVNIHGNVICLDICC